MGQSDYEKATALIQEAMDNLSQKPKKSVNLLDKAIKLYATPGMHYYRGMAYDRLNKAKKANDDYQEAMNLAGRNIDANQMIYALDAANNYGTNLQNDKKWSNLIQVATQGVQLCQSYADNFPDDVRQILSRARDQMVFLGKASYEKKKWEEAYVAYLRAKKLGEEGAMGNLNPETEVRIIELEGKLSGKGGIDWGKVATEGITTLIRNIPMG